MISLSEIAQRDMVLYLEAVKKVNCAEFFIKIISGDQGQNRQTDQPRRKCHLSDEK